MEELEYHQFVVVAWMLNSLSQNIAVTVETISCAAEVWKTLSKL